MDSANNSSSLQSSSGGDAEEFDSRTFFATATATATATNNTAVINTNNNHLHFFDSLSFLDPSFPLLTPLPNPPAPAPAPAPSPAAKNSKKRSRASRRAPTTVLTTDTSNFRAMVQEFTGIPAPPFSSTTSALSSSYPRSRFDFFNPTINAAAAATSSSSPSFLLKPYPHKLFPLPSNINNASSSTNTSNNNSSTVTSFSYLAGTQSPILNFQSLLQSQLSASSTADLGVRAHHHQLMMMPSTSAPAAGAEYGVADLRLPGLIGSGWGQDAGSDPTQLTQDVSNSCKLNF